MSDEFDDIMANSELREVYTHDDADAVRGHDGNKRLRWKPSAGVGAGRSGPKVYPKDEYPKKEDLDQPWEKWQVSDEQEFTYLGKKYRAQVVTEPNYGKGCGWLRCKDCDFAERKGGGGISANCFFIPSCVAMHRKDGEFVIYKEVTEDGSDNNK